MSSARKDEHVLAVDGDLLAAVLAVDDLVADLDGHGNEVAVLVELTFANCQNNAGLRLLLGLVSKIQAGCRGLGLVLTEMTRSPRGFKFIALPSFRFDCKRFR